MEPQKVPFISKDFILLQVIFLICVKMSCIFIKLILRTIINWSHIKYVYTYGEIKS